MHTRSIRAVLFAVVVLALSAASLGQVRISVRFGPPALPIYEQPICPGDGYIWTPGYWAWSDDYGDYYWVPGTWVEAPEVGFLWTPPFWGWEGDAFIFHEGYWGPQVGFYGGINYGFGYFGDGYAGGRWDNGHFFYNRSVTNINVTVIHNVYNETVVNRTENRVSYNGGQGGVTARPTPRQEQAEHERHLPPAAAQVQHVQAARGNPELRASANHGKPPVAASAKPGEFRGHDVVPAREAGGEYKAPPERGGAEPRAGNGAPAKVVHPSDVPAGERAAAPNTGNEKLDKKYQQQQEKLQQQQDKQRQNLQQQQDREHQKMAKQNADDAKKQQVEQKHQQQTQQLQQKHTQQQQKLQQRQTPKRAPAGPPKK